MTDRYWDNDGFAKYARGIASPPPMSNAEIEQRWQRFCDVWWVIAWCEIWCVKWRCPKRVLAARWNAGHLPWLPWKGCEWRR